MSEHMVQAVSKTSTSDICTRRLSIFQCWTMAKARSTCILQFPTRSCCLLPASPKPRCPLRFSQGVISSRPTAVQYACIRNPLSAMLWQPASNSVCPNHRLPQGHVQCNGLAGTNLRQPDRAPAGRKPEAQKPHHLRSCPKF